MPRADWITPVLLIAAASAVSQPSHAAERQAANAFQAPEFARFEEPLIPTGPTSPAEDAILLNAVREYQRGGADGFVAIEQFLVAHPRSPWRVALLTNLGLSYYYSGYFSKAIGSWEQAWRDGRELEESRARALVDRAV